MTSRSWAGYNISPPIGLYQLQYSLSKQGIDCEILDFDLEDSEMYLERTAHGEFDVIGMSVTHISMPIDLDVLQEFRSAAQQSGKPFCIVAGGQEATLNARQWLDTGVVDICFLGYCDYEFAEFCLRFRVSPNAGLEALTDDLMGFAFYDSGGGFRFYPSRLMDNERFQELFYDNVKETRIPYDAYWSRFRAERVDVFNNNNFTIETVRLYTSSHCPRKCGFCSSQNFLSVSQSANSKIIGLSPGQMCDLIVYCVETYGARAIMFSDDDFPVGGNAGLRRFDEFCDMVIAEKAAGRIPRSLRLFCQSRVLNLLVRNPDRTKQVDWDRLHRMKSAGFDSVGMGVETLSEELLRAPSVNKLGTTLEDIDMVVKGLIEVGITPMIYLILGIPESRQDHLIATIRKAVEYLDYGADVSLSGQMRALPGSPITSTSNDSYEISTVRWTAKASGQAIEIVDTMLPFDSKMRVMVEKLETDREDLVEEFLAERQWSRSSRLPRSLYSLIGFASAARLIDRQDVHDELMGLIDMRLTREHIQPDRKSVV